MNLFKAIVFAFLMTSGCGPARPPVTTGADECVPSATRCSPGTDSRPEVCSASHRWQPTAAEPCPVGSACCLVTSLDPGGQVHACAPADRSACVEPVSGGAFTPPAPPPEPVSAGDWSLVRSQVKDHGATEVAP